MLPLTEQKRKLIEKIGVFHESIGMQPVAGRILGLLIVSDRTKLTFDEIRETLGISKSAASNAINLLIQMDHLEYSTQPGDRRRFFGQKLGQVKERMTKKINEMLGFNVLLKEALELRNKETLDFNKHLEELISALDYLSKEIPKLLEEWEKRNQ